MKEHAEDYLDTSCNEPNMLDFCIPESLSIMKLLLDIMTFTLKRSFKLVLRERPYPILFNVVALVPFLFAIYPVSQKHTFGSWTHIWPWPWRLGLISEVKSRHVHRNDSWNNLTYNSPIAFEISRIRSWMDWLDEQTSKQSEHISNHRNKYPGLLTVRSP